MQITIENLLGVHVCKSDAQHCMEMYEGPPLHAYVYVEEIDGDYEIVTYAIRRWATRFPSRVFRSFLLCPQCQRRTR